MLVSEFRESTEPGRGKENAVPQVERKRGLARWVVVWLVLLAIPLVPFAILMGVSDRDPFEVLVEAIRGERAAGLVCFALLASDVFLPIPSSLVAIVSGSAAGAVGGGILNWVAITIGHTIGFFVARRWGRPIVERFVGPQGLSRAESAWQQGATVGLIISRPIPVLAEALSMFAGLAGFSWRRFFAVALIANLPHSFIYSWAGARAMDAGSLGAITLAGVGVPAVAYGIFVLWKRTKTNSNN